MGAAAGDSGLGVNEGSLIRTGLWGKLFPSELRWSMRNL